MSGLFRCFCCWWSCASCVCLCWLLRVVFVFVVAWPSFLFLSLAPKPKNHANQVFGLKKRRWQVRAAGGARVNSLSPSSPRTLSSLSPTHFGPAVPPTSHFSTPPPCASPRLRLDDIRIFPKQYTTCDEASSPSSKSRLPCRYYPTTMQRRFPCSLCTSQCRRCCFDSSSGKICVARASRFCVISTASAPASSCEPAW